MQNIKIFVTPHVILVIWSLALAAYAKPLISILPTVPNIEANTISMHFHDAPVVAALEFLAKYTNTNMVISNKIKGQVNLNLDNIPWNDALNILLTTNSLVKKEIGKVIIIEPQETAVKEPSSYQIKDEPLSFELIKLNNAKADELVQMLKQESASWLSARGSMGADSRINAIFIQDFASRIQKLKKLVQQFDIPLKQILIETRIVSVSKDVASDLGIHWKLKQPNINNESDKTLPQQLSFDLPLQVASQAAALNFAYLGAQVLLDLELSALESQHKAKVIASPSIVTGQLEEAYISSGQQIPYQETTSSGATSVTFKQAALSLKVTPRILPNKRVMLQLKINQDRPAAMLYNGVPAIATKEIYTAVLAHSGQTIVLGGIFESHQMQHQVRLPILGGLPFLGYLFSKTQKEEREEELLVFITPTILAKAKKIVAETG
ncbi:MAG: hypothetical protein A3F18_01210 [Legionellales bacterium RIFCSPHIGHO2_12_FULL_37_14]|nr:MAG: hypothetical protein A3F18_01210 [Legionellales bacterium RIFCSPHIGHO2_12_FULL_37_14]